MGYRRVPNILTLTDFKEFDGLVVRMKPIKYGRVRQLIVLADEDSQDSTEQLASAFQEHLLSWNLEEEDGTPIPVTVDGVDDQDFDFIMGVIQVWLDQVTGPDEELGKGSSNGSQFPGAPVTMEAL